MISPPPTIVRRLVVAPFAILVCLTAIVISPAVLVVSAIFDLARRGRLGLTRLVAFAVVFAAAEIAMILAMLGLWIASGFGLFIRSPSLQSAHYAVMRWWLWALSQAAIVLLGMHIDVVEPAAPQPGPILVFGRHAGVGNSLMMIRMLMLEYGRRPRVVMLAFLQWDPVVDLICHRVPSLFIEHRPDRADDALRGIGALAEGMGERDAFVIYPEGHDFTERLRQRAIAHLRKHGHHDAADQAEEMDRMLPPRHKGPLAAILAAPDADVVLVAHTTLEELGSFRRLHRRLPLARPIKTRYWRIPAAEVPRTRDELIPWLFAWWKTIDDWIDEHAPPLPSELPSETRSSTASS